VRVFPFFLVLAGVYFSWSLDQMFPQSATKSSSRTANLDPGSIRDNVYRNSAFGFSYKIPYGWVDRTQQMTEDASDPAQSRLLLAVFERPPEASADSINAAIVITAESVAAYPGIKHAENYFGALTEVATKQGFKVDNEPYEFQVGTKRLVRGDFNKEGNKAAAYQSSLVVLDKGYVLSLTFLAATSDDVDELIRGLSFSAAVRPAPQKLKTK